jgi:putative transposase
LPNSGYFEDHRPTLSFRAEEICSRRPRVEAMSRTARVVVPGMPMHITQRGSRRFDVFRDDEDRLDYLKLLRDCCRDYCFRIVAYCLMTNHVHYVAVPERLDSISLAFHRLNGAHSQRFNRKHGFLGHLWQERPFSCVLDESHLVHAVRYVEFNPVRARMVGDAADYPWSSAAAHCTGTADSGLDLDPPPFEIADWRQWLAAAGNEERDQFIRECTATGRPCGDDAFHKRIEGQTNRDFTRKKPGPKPKIRPEEHPLLRTDDGTEG